MSHSLLLPHQYKRIGWWLFIPSLLLGIFVTTNLYELPEWNAHMFSLIPEFSQDEFARTIWFIDTNLTNTIVGVLFIISALMVGFSKEQNEDEYIARLRLSSLLWAVLFNYILLLLSFIFVYGFGFFTVMIYNMFTVLLLFIFRFQYLLYRSKTALADEK